MRVEEIVGIRMREHREARDMTQEQLGEELGYFLGNAWSRQAVSSAEKGKRAFTAAELLTIADSLGITCADLLRPPPSLREIEMPSGWYLTPAALREEVEVDYPPIVAELITLLGKDHYRAQEALVAATKNLETLAAHLPSAEASPQESDHVEREPSAKERGARSGVH
ncbi:helix-turn-helix transcriptional regulator [Amycolatopsis eburnea]|uniref:helix-turn-helix transcriptional regulator n=1 Tax=Amycolatopsis eburnea TaxID=2267691 RepID=UPI0013154C7F|nr:helix-turn-helix transcriptional regulator [Amycolatopsis eburnea]